MLSPIQTIRHFLRSVQFNTADEEREDAAFKCHISLKHSRLEEHWHVLLGVEFEGKDGAPASYGGKVEYEGLFEIRADFPEEKREDLVKMNGGAILYGAIREYILGMTSRTKHGPLELPTIDARMFLATPKSSAKPAPEPAAGSSPASDPA